MENTVSWGYTPYIKRPEKKVKCSMDMSIWRKKNPSLSPLCSSNQNNIKPILSNMAAAGKHGLFELKLNNVKKKLFLI